MDALPRKTSLPADLLRQMIAAPDLRSVRAWQDFLTSQGFELSRGCVHSLLQDIKAGRVLLACDAPEGPQEGPEDDEADQADEVPAEDD